MPNRLASAASPYLRSAAHQPVEWYPWSEEAFRAAKESGKPILLDVGAVWCHWCHVMDRESYESAAVAAILNERFVCVKVDRDERPDVDVRYQKAVQLLTGQGGWPLTAFLTPDGEVFFGGTYFPPEDAHGRAGFPRVLEAVAEFWAREREKALEQARRLRAHLVSHADEPAPGEVRERLAAEIVESALAHHDPVHGGFSTAPKFPHCSVVDLLVRRATRDDSAALRDAALATLDGMRRGGVHDHLEGGFHRYGVDAEWIVPHFEKMLYDNAGLLANHVHAYAAWRRPDDRETALGVVRFLREVLERPEGGFGGSEDADVGWEDDGDYFTWTLEEARATLAEDELKVATLHWGLDEHGEMRHDPRRNVLHVVAEPPAIAAALGRPEGDVRALLASARGTLLAARRARPAPFVDPTVFASWNGMAAAALLEAAGALEAPEAEAAALRALDRLLREAWDEERGFAHALDASGPRAWGLLDDQVHMGAALAEAFVATGEARYLDAATAVARVLEARFLDGATFRDRATGAGETPALADAERPVTDSPTAAANPTAARFLLRLAELTGDARHRARADGVLAAFAGAPKRYGFFAATYGLAVDERLHPPPTVKLVGTAAATATLRAAARRAYAPGAAIVRVEAEPGVAPPAAIPCFGDRCLAPVREGEALARALRENR